MDLEDIFIFFGLVSLGIGGYFTVISGLASIQEFGRRKTGQELEKILDDECKKLNLDSSKIEIKYNQERCYIKQNGEKYDLGIKGIKTPRSIIRHELYHLFKGDLEHYSAIRYLFLEEPRAIVYGALKLKI